MTLKDVLLELAVEEASPLEFVPTSLSVEEKTEKFRLEAKWRDEYYDSILEETSFRYQTYYHDIPKASWIGIQLQNVFNKFYKSAETSENVVVQHPTLVSNNRKGKPPSEHFRHLPRDSNFYFVSSAELEKETNMESELLRLIEQEVSQFDKNFSIDDVVDIVFMYSDTDACELVKVEGTVKTENPHRYYNNVQTFDDWKDKQSKLSDEEIEETDEFEVKIFISEEEFESGIPNRIKAVADNYMENEIIKDSLKNYETLAYEGERISYEDGTETSTYWIYHSIEL